MKENTFYTILPFMVNDLNLSGNELLVYAIIYGFSQDGESWFYGSRKYLSECTNISKASVTRCLKALTDKGFIERKEVVDKKGNHVEYMASKESLSGGVVKNLNGGSKESLPNIYRNNNYFEKETHESTSKEIDKEDIWDLVEKLEPLFSMQCLKVFIDETGREFQTLPAKCAEFLNSRDWPYSVDDVRKMIRFKADEWEDTKYSKYIQPSTLFSPDHFEEYIMQSKNDEDSKWFDGGYD